MEGKESLFFIEGAAGVGKSFFLSVLKQGIEATGKEVFAVAPTGRASRENLAGDFENPQTIQHLLLNKKMQNQLRGNVLIVDEAPLADGASLCELLKVCKEQDCKVILQGDLKQQHAVAAIDGVRLLVKELGLGTKLHRLDVSRRQLKWEDKEIARTWSHGRVKEAIDLMIATGTVVEAKPDEGMAKLAKQYVEALSRKETALVVSSTHAQGDELTKKIRQERKDAGQIGVSDWTVRTDKELSDGATLSNGDKFFADSPTSYQVGMRLALKNRPGRADQVGGDKWEVVGLHETGIEVKRGNSSRVIDVTKERMANYAVYEPRELALTTGDRVRLQEKIVVSTLNRSSYQTINGPRAKEIYERGSIQTVASRREDGSVVFKSGLVLNANDGRLAQGYVSTSIPAQGSTVDWLFGYESVKSLKALANLASMYVNVSRHVKGMNFFTESIDALRTWGDRKHDRELALEAERHARLEAQELKLRHPNREVEFTVLPQSDEPKPAPVPTPTPTPTPSSTPLVIKPPVETVLPTQPTVKPSRLVALDDSPIPAPPPPKPPRIIPTIMDSSQQDKKSAAYREITKQLIEERLKSYTPKPPEQPEVEFS
jgi:hypothetical protein